MDRLAVWQKIARLLGAEKRLFPPFLFLPIKSAKQIASVLGCFSCGILRFQYNNIPMNVRGAHPREIFGKARPLTKGAIVTRIRIPDENLTLGFHCPVVARRKVTVLPQLFFQ